MFLVKMTTWFTKPSCGYILMFKIIAGINVKLSFSILNDYCHDCCFINKLSMYFNSTE